MAPGSVRASADAAKTEREDLARAQGAWHLGRSFISGK